MALERGFLLNEGEALEKCLKELEELVPNLEDLPQDCYPVEAYRLLNALDFSSSYSTENQINALHLLLPSFKHQAFGQLADRTLGLLLSGEFRKTLQAHQLDKEGLLLSLYAFRNQRHLPERNAFAQLALFKLIHGLDKYYGFQEKRTFEESTQVLTQGEFLNLLSKVLLRLGEDKSGSYETQLLEALVQSKVCNAFSLATACQSKTFLDVFKAQYPKADFFTTIEHCLLTASNDKTSFLMDVSKVPNQVVGESEVAEYALQLVQDKSLPVVDIIEHLKLTLEKALPEITDGQKYSNTDSYGPMIKNSQVLSGINDNNPTHYKPLFDVKDNKHVDDSDDEKKAENIEHYLKDNVASNLINSTVQNPPMQQADFNGQDKDIIAKMKNLADASVVRDSKQLSQTQLVDSISQLNYSVQELNALYNLTKTMDAFNGHRNPNTDTFFGIKNTASWQSTVKDLRIKALDTLFNEVDGMANAEEKIQHLHQAKTLALFCEHRNNSIFAGAFGRTESVTRIEDEIERIEATLKNTI